MSNDFNVVQISEEGKIKFLELIFVLLTFKVSRFQAPANSTINAGLF